MDRNAPAINTKASHSASRALLLLAAFAVAVALRQLVGGPGTAQSAFAGLVFAGCLFALGLAARTKFPITSRALTLGLAGAVVLGAPIAHYTHPAGRPPTDFMLWAGVVGIVAAAEEYFLRGALYESVQAWLGEAVAIIFTAAAFAALHVPLYGWRVLPLDFAVGLWLGALRAYSGTPAAPALAHILADWAAWWLH
jgi:membrane protease YdiL (CAAX protease family)